MGRKAKYSPEQKIQACIDYLSGKKSAIQIVSELKMGKHGDNRIRLWAKEYSLYGASHFEEKKKNQSYTKEFKTKVVKEYLDGKGSIEDLSIKYNISGGATLRSWVIKYNSHIELKEYDPKPEVYMADKLKTTFEERVEIVKYCLENGKDYKSTAARYGCNYSQLYQWVKKYEENGEEALVDKRGKRKKEEELTDIEKANRIIAELKRQNKELQDRYDVLKKAEERERW